MRIGLISDTHILHEAKALPAQVKEVFKGVDLILHAGDIYLSSVLDELEEIAPVLAARGDDDSSLVDRRVEEKHVLNIEGFSLWLIHIFPFYFSSHSLLSLLHRSSASSSQEPDEELEKAVNKLAENESIPDILVFGDTHKALSCRVQGFLFINPGSPTLPDYRQMLGTVGILAVSRGKVEADIIQL
jgi:putative phosphoesterase